MKSRAPLFNGFLMLLALALARGLRHERGTQASKGELSNIRIHVESGRARATSQSGRFRSSAPRRFRFNIEREPLLDEHNVWRGRGRGPASRALSFACKFDRQGTLDS